MPSNWVGSHSMALGFTYTEPPIVGSIFGIAFPAIAGMGLSKRLVAACSPDCVICWRMLGPKRRNDVDFETYKGSLSQEAPPAGISMAAQALLWGAKGDWHQAHQCAQKQAET